MTHFKITPLDKRNVDAETYTERLSQLLGSMKRDPVTKSKVQAPSMQATIDRDESLDAKHFFRSIDLSKAIAPHPETIERKIDPYEFNLIEGMRRGVKNTVGNSEMSATTPERREKAMHAFTYSQPADLTDEQKNRLSKLDAIKELAGMPREKIKKQSLWQKIYKIFTSNLEAMPPEYDTRRFIDGLSIEEKEEWELLIKEKK